MKISEKQLRKIISEAIQNELSGNNGELENLLGALNGVMQMLNDWIFVSAENDQPDAEISEELDMYSAYEAIGGLIERINTYLQNK